MKISVKRKGKIVQVDMDKCSIYGHYQEVLREKLTGGRFTRWTENDKKHLYDIIGQYQALTLKAMDEQDISQELHDIHILTGAISPRGPSAGNDVLREILLRWFACLLETLQPDES